jgi:hypothetical protein
MTTEPRGAERGQSCETITVQPSEPERDRHFYEAGFRAGFASGKGALRERIDPHQWLEADRAFVARMVDEDVDDDWGTRRLMWQQRLAAIDAELAALSDPAPQPAEGGE